MIAKHAFKNQKFPEFRTGCKDRRQVVRLLRYIQKESGKGKTLWNDFGGEDPLMIADEVDLLDRGHKYKGFHFILSAPADEQSLWEPKGPQLAQSFKRHIRASKIYARTHLDKATATWHVHIFAFGDDAQGRQLRLRGKRVDGGETSTPELLRQWCVQVEDETPGARKTGRGDKKGDLTLSKDELEMAARLHREGKRPTPAPDKLVLRVKVDELVRSSRSIDDLVTRGKEAGIEVRLVQYANGRGVSFSDGVTSLRGRDAGWSYKALVVFYEQPNRGLNRTGQIGIIETKGVRLRTDRGRDARSFVPGPHQAAFRWDGKRAAGLRKDSPSGAEQAWAKAVKLGLGKGGLPRLVVQIVTMLMRMANDPGMKGWRPEMESPI